MICYIYMFISDNILDIFIFCRLLGLFFFVGDIDVEIFVNVILVKWDFSVEEFESILKEVKDFILRLLVKDLRYFMIN